MKHGVTSIISRLNKDNRIEYLLIRSKRNKGIHTGKYYPPSGWIEEGETEEDALVRELKEELNLTIKPVRKIIQLTGDLPDLILHFWECEVLSGTIEINDTELLCVGWFTLEQMKSLDLYPATKLVFQNYL